MQEHDLTIYGLTKNQSIIYQKGLQYGTRSVTALARFCGLHRVLTYNVLQELCEMGLCSCIEKSGTGFYNMLNPSVLQAKLIEKTKLFEGVLPSLQSMVKQSGGIFNVQVFSGTEGLKTLYDLIAQSTTNLKAFLGADHIEDSFRAYLYDVYLPKRIAKGLHNRSIVSQTDHNAYFANAENVPLTTTVIIPDSLFDLSSEIMLFDEDKVSIACMSETEMSGLLIQSKNLHNTLDQLFELLRRIFKPQNLQEGLKK